MKFTEAWADVASKNTLLKAVIFMLSICCVAFAAVAARLALRDAVVVERGCVTKTAGVGSAERTAAEIEAFVREAVARRFNFDAAPSEGFLSPEEDLGRKKDLEALANQGMRQRVLVNSVNVDGNTVTLDCDRLISVGSVRSAFGYPLTATIATTTRTESNPYGLVLVKFTGPESGKKEKKR